MRINEILNETEDWIRTYWALKSVDIDSFEAEYTRLSQIYYETHSPLVKSVLLKTYSELQTLLSSPDWGNLESDADYEKVYGELLNVYESIEKTLRL